MARLKLILVYSIITLFILFAICMEGCTKIEYIIVEKKTTDTLIVFVNNDSNVVVNDLNIVIDEGLFEAITDTIVVNDTLPSIRIGNQTWASVNLSVDHFNDGSLIKYAPDDNDWNKNEPAYCYWLNNPSFDTVYGKLYNWYAVETNKLCPVGWRVPTIDDINVLHDHLKDSIGAFLKEIGYNHWIQPNRGAVDKYGFTALPGQLRWYNGYFWPINTYEDQSCNFWTSSIDEQSGLPIYISILNNAIGIIKYRHSKNIGFSIRCIKN